MTHKKATKRCSNCNIPLSVGLPVRTKYCPDCAKHSLKMAHKRWWKKRHAVDVKARAKAGIFPKKFDDDYFNMTLAEISKIEGVSRQRVDQIAREAMGKFKIEWESRYDAPDFDEIIKFYSQAMLPGLGSMATEISLLRSIPMNNKH